MEGDAAVLMQHSNANGRPHFCKKKGKKREIFLRGVWLLCYTGDGENQHERRKQNYG